MKIGLLFLTCMARLLAQANVCALEVHVVGRDSTPKDAVKVHLRDPKGQVVDEATTINGIASFCDFGFGPHSLSVGDADCMPIIVKNIRIDFEATQSIRVLDNECRGGDGGTNACHIRFRIRDSRNSTPIERASVVVGEALRWHSDKYGRVTVGVLQGRTNTFKIEASGYEDLSLQFGCTRAGLNTDQDILLKRR